MVRIDLRTNDRSDARKHLRQHYAGCVLLDRDYGFDMLLPLCWSSDTESLPSRQSTGVAMVILNGAA